MKVKYFHVISFEHRFIYTGELNINTKTTEILSIDEIVTKANKIFSLLKVLMIRRFEDSLRMWTWIRWRIFCWTDSVCWLIVWAAAAATSSSFSLFWFFVFVLSLAKLLLAVFKSLVPVKFLQFVSWFFIDLAQLPLVVAQALTQRRL